MKKGRDEYIERRYKETKLFKYILPSLVIIILVNFASAYFKYYAIAIKSGFIKTVFDKRTVVVQQINKDYNLINIGNIVVYQRIIISLFVECIVNKKYFYTKEDANFMKIIMK